MRDINQKASDTDKQIAIAKRCCEAQIAHSAAPKPLAVKRSAWLSSLLSLGAISTGGLSIFSVAALLGMKPAQANMTEPSASLPPQIVEEEQATPTSSQSSELNAQVGFHQALVKGEPNETAKENVQTSASLSSNQLTSEPLNLKASDAVLSQGQLGQAMRAPAQPPLAKRDATAPFARVLRRAPNSLTQGSEYNFAPSAIERGHFSSLQPQSSTGETAIAVPTANSLSFASAKETTPNRDQETLISTEKPATVLPAFVPPSMEEAPIQNAVESQVPQLQGTEQEQVGAILPGFSAGATAFSHEQNAVEYKVLGSDAPGVATAALSADGQQPTTVLPTFALGNTSAPTPAVEPSIRKPVAESAQPTTILPTFALRNTQVSTPNPVAPSVPKPVARVAQPTLVAQTTSPDATAAEPAPYSGPGAAALLGGTIQAQSSVDAAQEAQSQNAAETNNPLAPSLVFQGGFITQGETGARARLTGLYPVSPNLLFGGTLDLTTGEGFSDTPGTGLDVTELYVTTSLPSYPNLRLTAGLVDLTSYFDRNSFAKDSLTHFFNPVFQTNPALARTGIASRPAVLLNWDITDNFQARAAGFSSSRNLGELDVDGFAGELAFRTGNAIIRGTFVTDRDDQRNGFEEIYGIRRSNGELGPRSSDRETAYGVNAEYYIPEIKMGLFGRYGHYENTSLDRGGDTYSLGLNFLDLFMKNDRLGFGYGRDLSNDSLRRANRNKVPDVWEVFYDFRLTSYLRAGVTLQARDEFSDIVAGFRVKTEFDLLNLGRAFR